MKAQPFLVDSQEALDLAFQVYPEHWYEGKLRWRPMAVVFFVAGLVLLFQIKQQIVFNLWFSLAGLLCNLIGLALDGYSTHQTMRLKADFDRREIAFPVGETNPFLPLHPGTKDQLSIQALLPEILLLLVTIVAPALGVAALVARIEAVLTNLQYARRLRLVLKMIEGRVTVVVEKGWRGMQKKTTLLVGVRRDEGGGLALNQLARSAQTASPVRP